MKNLVILIALLVISPITLAQELHYEGKAEVKVSTEKEETAKELATALGIVYVGMTYIRPDSPNTYRRTIGKMAMRSGSLFSIIAQNSMVT